jgi:hypothetical protein
MFDGNMMGLWRTFIHLKGVRRLESKMSNVAKFMEAEFFPNVRSKGG